MEIGRYYLRREHNTAAINRFRTVITDYQTTSHVPEALVWAAVRLVRLVKRHQGELLAFFTTMATNDVVAPRQGARTLADHYRTLGGNR